MDYHLHSIIPVDIHKLDDKTYAIELIGDCLTSLNSTFIFLIFLINYDSSIEREPLYINNIRKDENKTAIYEKLISMKTKDNTFFLDWKFVFDPISGYYGTDLASKEHKGIISDKLYVTKNMFLQTCIFLSLLNDKADPHVYLNILSDEEYKNIKKTKFTDKIPSNTYKFIYGNKLYIIFKADCIRYIEINKKEKNKNDKTNNQ